MKRVEIKKLYIQAKLPVKIDLVVYRYQNILSKKLSCIQSLTNFPLALSFSPEKLAKAFLLGTSGAKGLVEFWQNTI